MPAPSSNQGPVRVFVSFSSEDDDHLQQLENHLSALKREGAIEVWTHHALLPGEAWEPTLLGALHDAELVILLVSADFMASDYIHEKELAATLGRHRRGDVWVVPVLIRPVDVKGTWFDELQGLPPGRKPVSQWRNRDEAWTTVANGVRALLPRLLERRARKTTGMWIMRPIRELPARLLTGRSPVGVTAAARETRRKLFVASVAIPSLLMAIAAATAWKQGAGGRSVLAAKASLSLEAWAFTSEGALEAPLFRPLEEGAEVKPGPIHFGLLVSQPAYVRLFFVNRDGEIASLYPDPGAPPLLAPGGERYVIPWEQCCLILGRSGEERFLVVAARRPEGTDAVARDLVAGINGHGPGGAAAQASPPQPDAPADSLEGLPDQQPLSFWTGSAIGGLAAGTHFRAWPGTATENGAAVWRMLTFRHIAGEETQ